MEKRLDALEKEYRDLKTTLHPILVKLEEIPHLEKLNECMDNLSELWKLCIVYRVRFGGKERSMQTETGADFWLKLTQTSPPLIGPDQLTFLICPASGEQPRKGHTTYRGPNVDANILGDNDPIGCCDPRHHPGGAIQVLFKNSAVRPLNPTHELYKKALRMTAGMRNE